MNKVYSQVSALNKPLQLTASLLMGVMGSTFMGAGVVLALPTGSAVTSGTATIQQTGSQMTINQASDRAIINWGDFSIGATEQVTFKQPGITSATLNRVTGNTASNIFGVLKANGQIFLINPNGILFGTSAKIDVSGLAASTLNVSDNDFLDFSTNKPYTLTSVSGKNPASVENQGTITVRNSGFAALVAPQVRNSGIINASLGKVVLAGGTAATVDFTGDGLISLTVDPNVVKQVTHTGNITANGGVIALAAGTGGSVLDNVINTTGVIQANSVNAQAGKIILSGGDSGPVAVGGTIRTTGSLTATGNAINVNTANITAPSANFNATGDINFTQPYSSRGSNLTLASTTGNISTRAINTFGGNISMSSAGGITTNSQRLNTSNGALNGGNISLTAGSGNITTGQLLSYSGGTAHGNVGNGGNINLTASNGSISTSGIYSYSDSGTGNSQKGGSVSLNANNGNVTTGGLYSYSASASGVAGNGGAINISASGTNAGNISVSVIQSGSYAGTTAGLGGDVRLIAGGNLTLGSANDFVKNSNNYGNILLSGGNISLTPGATTIRGETITATGNITAANAVNSSIALLATGNISTQGIKTYGNAINLSSSNGGITTNNQLLDTRNGANNGGAITLNAGNGGITTGTLNSYSYSNSGNSGNGGAITLNATNGSINNGDLKSLSRSNSNSGSSGNGGAITLNASNDINTGVLDSHSEASGTSGTGGTITLNAT
ncbi:MAG: filamentous hemagglutinin N-terminal domain-containing protein, partial [Aphanothece sp. CMT-3BRIN-NPC111]|nr:filamentous hemagglutinin N-terminal domain-containing protein [Aphanothece sp. CMT-3BRIN-NPC111]